MASWLAFKENNELSSVISRIRGIFDGMTFCITWDDTRLPAMHHSFHLWCLCQDKCICWSLKLQAESLKKSVVLQLSNSSSYQTFEQNGVARPFTRATISVWQPIETGDIIDMQLLFACQFICFLQTYFSSSTWCLQDCNSKKLPWIINNAWPVFDQSIDACGRLYCEISTKSDWTSPLFNAHYCLLHQINEKDEEGYWQFNTQAVRGRIKLFLQKRNISCLAFGMSALPRVSPTSESKEPHQH